MARQLNRYGRAVLANAAINALEGNQEGIGGQILSLAGFADKNSATNFLQSGPAKPTKLERHQAHREMRSLLCGELILRTDKHYDIAVIRRVSELADQLEPKG